MTINSVSPQILGSYNAMVPNEGPKVIPVVAQLAVNASVLVDLSQLQQQGKISFIQGVMVDNSNNSSPVTITSQTFNQNLVIPANSQAILPVFVSNPPIFTISSNGTVNVPVFFFNIPLPAQVWGGSEAFTFSGGKLLVSDPILEGLISNFGTGNGLNVNVISGGSSNASSATLIFSNRVNNSTVSSSASGSGLKWHITALRVAMSEDALISSYTFPTFFRMTFNLGGEVIDCDIHPPTTTPLGYQTILADLAFTNPIVDANSNDIINAFINGGSLSQGYISFNVWGYAA